MGQTFADLEGDVDPGFGRRRGQAFGVAEQQANCRSMTEVENGS